MCKVVGRAGWGDRLVWGRLDECYKEEMKIPSGLGVFCSCWDCLYRAELRYSVGSSELDARSLDELELADVELKRKIDETRHSGEWSLRSLGTNLSPVFLCNQLDNNIGYQAANKSLLVLADIRQ